MATTSTVVIGSTSGLHSRPASLFAKAAAASGNTVSLSAGEKKANGASLLALMTLGLKMGDEVAVTVEGDGEEAVLEELAALLASNLDEA